MVESLPIGGKSLTQDCGGTCKDRKGACEECAILILILRLEFDFDSDSPT